MAESPSVDEVVQAARELDREEFTRREVAAQLGREPVQIREGFKAARVAGRIKKIGENAEGRNVFSVAE